MSASYDSSDLDSTRDALPAALAHWSELLWQVLCLSICKEGKNTGSVQWTKAELSPHRMLFNRLPRGTWVSLTLVFVGGRAVTT